MRGVDGNDQLRKYYNITRKSKVWYKKIYGYLLEVSIHNARVMFENATKKKCCPIQFREKLAMALIGTSKSTKPQLFNAVEVPSSEKRLRRDIVHLPALTEDGVSKHCHCCREKSKAAAQAGQDQCKIMHTRFLCVACNAPLSLTRERNCFEEYHQTVDFQP